MLSALSAASAPTATRWSRSVCQSDLSWELPECAKNIRREPAEYSSHRPVVVLREEWGGHSRRQLLPNAAIAASRVGS